MAHHTRIRTLTPIAGLILTSLGMVFPAPAFAENRSALIVGIDKYDVSYGANALNGCVNDATSLRGALLQDKTRWSLGQVTTLTNADATKSGIFRSLETLAATSGPGDVCVYYQSSHGGQYSGRS